MSVGPGELVCVVGRVGSGKSSLIGALLGKSLVDYIVDLPASCSCYDPSLFLNTLTSWLSFPLGVQAT